MKIRFPSTRLVIRYFAYGFLGSLFFAGIIRALELWIRSNPDNHGDGSPAMLLIIPMMFWMAPLLALNRFVPCISDEPFGSVSSGAQFVLFDAILWGILVMILMTTIKAINGRRPNQAPHPTPL